MKSNVVKVEATGKGWKWPWGDMEGLGGIATILLILIGGLIILEVIKR